MENRPLGSLGAQVVVTSSGDESHPPENIIDGRTESCWLSTGLFPQELIIRLPDATKVSAVTLDTYNVKRVRLEKNSCQSASQFQPVAEKECEQVPGRLQSNTVPVDGSVAAHLRLVITSGHDHFVSVHRVSVHP